MAWAEDQSGCGDKKDFFTSSEDQDSDAYLGCRNAFLGPFQCNRIGFGESDDSSTGGYYVYNTQDSGCKSTAFLFELTTSKTPTGVLTELYAIDLQQNLRRDAPSNATVHSSAVDDVLASLPDLGHYNSTSLLWISNATHVTESGKSSYNTTSDTTA